METYLKQCLKEKAYRKSYNRYSIGFSLQEELCIIGIKKADKEIAKLHNLTSKQIDNIIYQGCSKRTIKKLLNKCNMKDSDELHKLRQDLMVKYLGQATNLGVKKINDILNEKVKPSMREWADAFTELGYGLEIKPVKQD